MSIKVTIVVGNPKPASRTRRVAELLVEKLLAPGTYQTDVIDLADHVSEIFLWPSDAMAALNRSTAASDLVVFASPTYKGTYTGLLKAFLDRYPANGLKGVTAIPVHTGADLTHAMGPTFTLAPLLMELGAVVQGRGFYLPLTQLADLESIVTAAAAEYAAGIRRTAKISEALNAEGVVHA